jgi:hypothetical protein
MLVNFHDVMAYQPKRSIVQVMQITGITMKTSHLCFSLPILVLLTACASPQQRCINQATRDMEVVDQLIADIEGNLQRGFALARETVYRTEFQDCTPAPTAKYPNPKPKVCPVEVPETVTRPVAVDLTAESAKLASLEKKRAQQGKTAAAAIAQCRTSYPE